MFVFLNVLFYYTRYYASSSTKKSTLRVFKLVFMNEIMLYIMI